jgi:hypothetical protein
MKPHALTKYSSKTLCNAWRRVPDDLNAMKARGGDGCDLDAIAQITDQVLDRIEAYSPTAPSRGAP